VKKVIVTGSFDNLASRHVRLLEEAAKLGSVRVLLFSDEAARPLEGATPRFPVRERLYLLQAIRYVKDITLLNAPVERDAIAQVNALRPDAWVSDEAGDCAEKRAYCQAHGVEYRVLQQADLQGFPVATPDRQTESSSGKKVIVTGCFDWFHSGHVRFFEEVSERGDLYVVVGHDANLRLLKGEGHPLFPQDERRYMVQSIRYVKQALIATGHGWMDAEPEIAVIKPDIYAVNEDGDQPEKRVFCQTHDIEYVVLKRLPKEGLPARQSTDLRGF
jgi:cytidyltransferase-like protein